MPHVPHDAVFIDVEDAVQRKGQLHDAQIGRQVAAGFGDRLHQEAAQLVGKLSELFFRQTLDVQ